MYFSERLGLPLIRSGMLFSMMLSMFSVVHAASVDSGRYEIEDAGQPRVMTVAMDEVFVGPPGKGRVSKISARSNIADLRRFARDQEKSTGNTTLLVMYEEGRERNDYSRRIVTGRLLLQVKDGFDAQAIAAEIPGAHLRQVEYAPGSYVLEFDVPEESLDASVLLKQRAEVARAEPMLARLHSKRFMPNDSFFNQQWHLRNTNGLDIAVTNVWVTRRGTGIVVGVVDDGLQTAHPDLAPNFNAALSYDFNEFDGDPSPDYYYDGYLIDAHGTSCAGLIAAKGNNALGVAGVAYEASLAGLRLIAAPVADDQEAAALSHSNQAIHIKSNSWGPSDDGATLSGPGPLTLAALQHAVTYGRQGRGTIFVWSGGNGGANLDNVNYDGYANSMYTIAIGAVSNTGNRVSYSETGACLVVCATVEHPSQSLTTTDLEGEDGYNWTGASSEIANTDYTRNFNGTSAAAPVISGVCALMLQANPNLGWRDVQEILIRTARKVDVTAAAFWRTNSAGFAFSHRYGAGLVVASNAVATALTWTNLGPRYQVSMSTNFSRATPTAVNSAITNSFVVTNLNLRVEHAELTVDISHTYRGDLAVMLVSPRGHTSIMATAHNDPGPGYSNWTFMTVQSWGESSTGTWRAIVADRVAGDTGTWTRAVLTLHGVPIVAAQPPVIQPMPPFLFAVSNPASFSVTATSTLNAAITLAASNLPAGANFVATDGTGTFSWASAQPVGVYTAWFYAANSSGVSSQGAVITVSGRGRMSFAQPYYVMDERRGILIDLDRLDGVAGSAAAEYSTKSGSAISDADFEATQGKLEYFPGGTNRSLVIYGLDDNLFEGPEYFEVVITNVTYAGYGPVVTAHVVVVDDEVYTAKMSTNFNAAALPSGWTVSNVPANSPGWRFDNPGSRTNFTGGSGAFAIADSDFAGQTNIDTSLLTPVLDLRDCLKVDVSYHHDFKVYSGAEYGDIDVSTNGKSGPWTNVWWHGGYDESGSDGVDISEWAAGKSNVVVRFRYYNANYDWWWQLDDVEVRGELDVDGDGMADWWETEKFSTLTNSASADQDGDGASNLAEYWADTDPASSGSVLEFQSIAISNRVWVEFDGSPVRSYQVWAATNLDSQVWTTQATNVPGGQAVSVPMSELTGAYIRVQANKPP